ncbi:unnamed protein product [Rhizopus stolonifer]
MFGSLDCMHWEWKNCSAAWYGQFLGKKKTPTIILEAVASYDLWIWHAFFGLPGSLSDINVLNRSHLFKDLADGNGPQVDFSVNDNTYKMGYYLTDGIYPPFATFFKSLNDPKTAKEKLFAKAQEAVRKDVERAFGVLQSRSAIVAGPARMWNHETLYNIMTTCVILHNIIVECERERAEEQENGDDERMKVTSFARFFGSEAGTMSQGSISDFLTRYMKIRDRDDHFRLRNDLMENLWQIEGDRLRN